jgi:DNA-binding GntR family transcriptional regulator
VKVTNKKKAGEKKPLVVQAYELLKEKIVTMEFSPGMKIEELLLMESLKLGRTPVREAIKMLASEGLIVSNGSNATYVKELTLKSAKDLFLMLYHIGDVIFALADPDDDYREIVHSLETIYRQMDQAIKKGDIPNFAKLNAGFHRQMAKIAKNEYLNDLLERLYCEELRLAFALSLPLGKVKGNPYKSYYKMIQQQHRGLIEMLKIKDLQKLRTAYRDHLAAGQKRMSAFFAESVEQKQRIITSGKGVDGWTF